MENLTHTLAGLALARAGLGTRSPFAVPVLIAAANLPDVDVFAAWAGLSYLDVHRGVTHGVAGTLALSAAGSGAVWAAARLRGRRDVRYLPLAAVALAGVASHPLLDLLNDYGIRPWLPWSGRWYYGDLVSVADPWLWIVLGAALASGSDARSAWLLLAALLVAVVTALAGAAFGAAWMAAAVAAYFAYRRLQRRGAGIAARVALLGLAAYVGWMGLARARVKDAAERAAPAAVAEPVERVDVLPARLGRWGRWTVVASTAPRYYIAESGVFDPRGSLVFEAFEKQLGHPCYREALADRKIAAMARFARFPSADVRPEGTRCVVFLRDLRYARRSVLGWGVASAEIPRAGR